MRRFLILLAIIVSTLTACASSPPRAQRSEFEDIPVPKGLVLDWSRSTIIRIPDDQGRAALLQGPPRAGQPRRRVPDHAGGQ